MKQIYLAGFDVFAPDAKKRGAQMKLQCAQHGFAGLYPLDNEADSAAAIFKGNLALIDACNLVIANLNPFRGAEPDSGTAFEVGYAHARGIPVIGYLSDMRSMREKLGTHDTEGFSVENFSHPLNLMLSEAATLVEGGFLDALAVAARTH